MSTEQLASQTPPSEIVSAFTNQNLIHPEDRMVLDVGVGALARNSIHVALRGFGDVLGIDADPIAIAEAKQRAARAGATACRFMVADCADLSQFDTFNSVLCNEVLQDFDKSEAHGLLESLRAHTRPGGYNVISTYMADKYVGRGSRGQLFCEGELARSYQLSGWSILVKRERVLPPQEFRGEVYPRSLTSLVARRS